MLGELPVVGALLDASSAKLECPRWLTQVSFPERSCLKRRHPRLKPLDLNRVGLVFGLASFF